ncbi:hypothetical protein BSLG_006052 [Batrachochytrium salamandrivorans]|nr:hypothetical protein BSLG_006052 [Batrachochytrium salamandrivorans]
MEIKKRFTTAMIMSLSSQDRQRLIGLGIVKHKDELVFAPSKKVLFPNGFCCNSLQHHDIRIDSIPRSCKDEGDLPLMDMLEQRLRFISGIQGLGDPPTPESAKLISFALDHLKHCTGLFGLDELRFVFDFATMETETLEGIALEAL